MRSYQQYCSVAKALDVVGDRWVLLIIRELTVAGPSRYTDLMKGLPGIATNLLADRLRDMEESGLIRREEAPPPIATTLFQLTDRGLALKPVLEELGRWGAPLMGVPTEGNVFRSHWLVFPFELHMVDRAPKESPVTIEVRTGDEPMLIEAKHGKVRSRPGAAAHPDAVISGRPGPILGLITGRLSLAEARKRGLEFKGNPKVLNRLVGDPQEEEKARAT
jgi:DNA-binding HxlR family transcriptional regulator